MNGGATSSSSPNGRSPPVAAWRATRLEATPLRRKAGRARLLDHRGEIVLVDQLPVATALRGEATGANPAPNRLRISTGSLSCLDYGEHGGTKLLHVDVVVLIPFHRPGGFFEAVVAPEDLLPPHDGRHTPNA